jgi:hypothetical protein
MAATLARLKELHAKVGDVGVDKLLRAAKKENLAVDRQLVKDFLSTGAPAQIFRPLPESKGKTGAEAQGFRLMADLIDYSRRKAKWNGAEWGYILVVMDVASRRVWAVPTKTKAPQHVAPVLHRLIRTVKNSDGINEIGTITTDMGPEWRGESANVMESEGLAHRDHDPADANVTAVLDRAIMNLKRRLAQSLAAKGRAAPWPSRVAQVVQQYNNTYHPAIRDEPEDFNKAGHAVKRFLAEQDNAEKLAHNQTLLEKRKAKLEAEGAYRVPVGGLNKFRRSFYQSYSSDVKEVDSIKGSMVRDKDGESTDVKRILAVDVFSGKAEDGMRGRNPRIENQKDTLMPLVTALYTFLEPGERISTTAAAEEIKRAVGDAAYRDAMRKAAFSGTSAPKQGQLARALELFDEFEVEPGGRYLRRVG